MQTTEKIASIPVTVKRAMTSAADVITMYEDLAKQGITNVNFKLTGFANGGMYAKMPYNLKWEKAVSKDTSMQELLEVSGVGHVKAERYGAAFLNEIRQFEHTNREES